MTHGSLAERHFKTDITAEILISPGILKFDIGIILRKLLDNRHYSGPSRVKLNGVILGQKSIPSLPF